MTKIPNMSDHLTQHDDYIGKFFIVALVNGHVNTWQYRNKTAIAITNVRKAGASYLYQYR